MALPNLREEKRLLREGHLTICSVDEVGRGALSGPVTVGVVVIDASVHRTVVGVRDSKLLSAQVRRELVPRIQRWAVEYAVGHSSANEIDALGIIGALRLAGLRALNQLSATPSIVLLDGTHDWLTPPSQSALFEVDSRSDAQTPDVPDVPVPPVVTRVKADLQCASVAAASVLAKVERDDIMVELAALHPEYGWEINKGYAAPQHREALARLGPCDYHRRSWNLMGSPVGSEDDPQP